MRHRSLNRSACVLAAVLALSPVAMAGTVSTSVLTDNETDIVNTGLGVVSAANFGSAAGGTLTVDINGIVHTVASATDGGSATENLTGATLNSTFDGHYRAAPSTAAGYTGDMQNLMAGIAGNFGPPNPLILKLDGLTIGESYLFQGYWEANNFSQVTTVSFTSGADTGSQTGITGNGTNGVLISYSFTAGDTQLTVDRITTFAVSDDNPWWQGYSLQVAAGPPTLDSVFSTTSITGESDIVNTGAGVVAAQNFGGTGAVTVNGIDHANSNSAYVPVNFTGDFANPDTGTFTAGSDLFKLLDGIAGTNNANEPGTITVGGLTIGETYLFQAYWIVNNGEGRTLDVTLEGESFTGIAQGTTSAPVLISYQFTAIDEEFNGAFVGNGSDGNLFLSGFSLQLVGEASVVPTPAALPAGLAMIGLVACRERRRTAARHRR